MAHLIAESLGYCTPSSPVKVLKDAREGKKNFCEWMYSCYDANPLRAVRNALKNRHYHKGFMADYKTALALVNHAIRTGEEPVFGSWC